MSARSPRARHATLAAALVLLGACGPLAAGPGAGARTDPPTGPRPRASEKFESERFIVVFARPGDTTASLAARHLGDAGKAWMIEDFNRLTRVRPGQEIVIPRQPWNPSGVEPNGYQVVPVLVYHDLAPRSRGRLVVAAPAFEQQMRHLKEHDFRVVSLEALYEFLTGRRQLPRRSVVLTFDNGYRSFLEHARPVLKTLGFPATLFVTVEHVGRGEQALTWEELGALAAEGFPVEAHGRAHADLRRHPGESHDQHVRRLQAEVETVRRTMEERLGRPPRFFAYPYGGVDDTVVEQLRRRGFLAGLTLGAEGNPSFARLYRVRRLPVWGDTTLGDFARRLVTFAEDRRR